MDVAVARIAPAEVAAQAVETLGLDPTVLDLLSPEALAASIRRGASLLCPATPGALVRAVSEVLSDLPTFTDEHSAELHALVESLVSHGDLLELPLDAAGGTRRHIFLGPPAFVRQASACLLLGIRPDSAPLVGEELSARIDYNLHVRLIRPHPSEDLASLLADEGLLELAAEQWLQAPRGSPPEALLEYYSTRLAARPPTGDLEGLRLIDPTADVTYYRGRWRLPSRGDTGNFVARRPQAYGADLWCFASLADGIVTRVLDLPLADRLASGADEGWRLQAAIDATRDQPQRVRLRPGSGDDLALLDLFGPVPRWAQRRLDVLGVPVLRGRGALFSYQLPLRDLDGELSFLGEMLWLSRSDERPSQA